MKMIDAKVGMTIRISMGKCTATDKLCGLHSEMKKLKGTLTQISVVNKKGIINTYDGWSWHPDDLIYVSPNDPKVKKVKPILFDEKMVWIE